MINKNGDAFFNNITARGAIKTAVFEYAEIQAVGGVFLFRPSSTIRSATVSGNNLVVTVDNPAIFKTNQYVKVSNYYTGNYGPDQINPNTDEILQNNGLLNIYKISSIFNGSITLLGAAAMVGQGLAVEDVNELVGGALVDMGNAAGTSNYGIGINSSDNTVNLPARAISLFNTTVNTSATGDTPKITYDYTGILGTLPVLTIDNINNDNPYDTYMVGTQGIYTDNMYIGDANQYIAFYTDKESTPAKHMIIKAKEFTLETEEESETNGYIYLSNTNKYRTGDQNTAWRFIIGPNFRVTSSGNLYAANADITGVIKADTGYIGGSGGWTIKSGAIYSGTTSKTSTIAGTYIGTDAIRNYGTNSQYVHIENGQITAYGADIHGIITATDGSFTGTITANGGSIGGWQIGTDINKSLHNGSANTSPTPGSGVIILSKGITTNAVGNLPAETYTITAGTNFGVTTAGAMYAKSGNIAGWDIGTGSLSYGTIDNSSTSKLYLGSVDTSNNITIGNSGSRKDWRLLVGNKFGVDDEGNLYANGGNIGGCDIEGGVLKISDANIKNKLSANVIDTSTITLSTDRIECNSSNWAKVTSDGLEIYQGGNSVASYGETARIGKGDGYHTIITDSSFIIEDEDGISLLEITPEGSTTRVQQITTRLPAGTGSLTITTGCHAGVTRTFWYGTSTNSRSITFNTTSTSINQTLTYGNTQLQIIGRPNRQNGVNISWVIGLKRSQNQYAAGEIIDTYINVPLLSFAGKIEATRDIVAQGVSLISHSHTSSVTTNEISGSYSISNLASGGYGNHQFSLTVPSGYKITGVKSIYFNDHPGAMNVMGWNLDSSGEITVYYRNVGANTYSDTLKVEVVTIKVDTN